MILALLFGLVVAASCSGSNADSKPNGPKVTHKVSDQPKERNPRKSNVTFTSFNIIFSSYSGTFRDGNQR